MKKIVNFSIILIAALAAVNLTACEDKKDNGKLDPEAKVYINGKELPQSAQAKAVGAQERLTIRQVIEQANAIKADIIQGLGVDEWNRDLDNNRLQMASTAVIAQTGELTLEFITARDMILVTLDDKNHPADTIAYLPNNVMITAETKVRAAYDAEDYTTCYKLFEEAFIFYPITGAEWLALKAAGNN